MKILQLPPARQQGGVLNEQFQRKGQVDQEGTVKFRAPRTLERSILDIPDEYYLLFLYSYEMRALWLLELRIRERRLYQTEPTGQRPKNWKSESQKKRDRNRLWALTQKPNPA